MIKSTVNQFANSLGLNKDEYIPEGRALPSGIYSSLFNPREFAN